MHTHNYRFVPKYYALFPPYTRRVLRYYYKNITQYRQLDNCLKFSLWARPHTDRLAAIGISAGLPLNVVYPAGRRRHFMMK